MEPLHLTEFASKRYYEKLEQLPREQQQQQQQQQQHHQQIQHHQHQHQHDDGQYVEGSSSKFILPIRQAEQQGHESLPWHGELSKAEKEKRRLFPRLRSSKSVSTSESQPQRRPSLVSATSATSVAERPAVKRKSVSFDQLFLNLPTELQIQIIASLPLSDVLNLRLASRSWHSMVTMNEVPIVRYQLEYAVPAYAKRLYPITDATGYSLHYLCSLWHRLHVAAKLAGRMCDWCTKEIFLRTTKDQVAGFAAQRERMYRRLIPLLFTLFHFFENYRRLHIQYIQEHGYGVERSPYTVNPIEAKIMSLYDDRTLFKVHQVFPMVVSSFLRRLRPPSYVGRLERTVRGYLREKPADEISTAVLCLGGLRQVLRLWEVKGYNTRVGTAETWYSEIQGPREKEHAKIAQQAAASKEAKARRGIMGLGRKKSSWQVRDAAPAAEDMPLPPSGRGSLEQAVLPYNTTTTRRTSAAPAGLVFHTSLARGMPMDRLEHDQYRALLCDLPVLQKLWAVTAEGLILDRKIVARAADIKRNAQVMLDLIKEDGVVEEDIWWYGMGATESIRPPHMEAIEEDTIE